jgi:hypothetical protein
VQLDILMRTVTSILLQGSKSLLWSVKNFRLFLFSLPHRFRGKSLDEGFQHNVKDFK